MRARCRSTTSSCPFQTWTRAAAFYSAALAPPGWKLVWDEAPTLGFGGGGGGGGEDDEPLAFHNIEVVLHGEVSRRG